MAKKEVYPHLDALALYDKLLESSPGIERKGANVPYTSMNGNMFSALDEHGVLRLRLPEKDREEFIKKYKTHLAEAYGIVLKEYVEVSADLFKKTKELTPWFKKSVGFVSSLKPKPTKK